MSVLRAHRVRQNKERLKAGAAWQATGKVFVQEDGSWLRPDTVSREFRRVSDEVGLPPINLRDLRHSTITLTSDTYTSLMPQVDKAAAEAAARLVPRARPAVAANTASDTTAPASLPHEG
ncbi:hypothetical protein [Streptomyces sp. NPDC050504]|uniref:hypothetical protein n=1 Tax=Streptomyces sp. NPDC050504 TaxID=3365618 RepID=UPI00379472E5